MRKKIFVVLLVITIFATVSGCGGVTKEEYNKLLSEKVETEEELETTKELLKEVQLNYNSLNDKYETLINKEANESTYEKPNEDSTNESDLVEKSFTDGVYTVGQDILAGVYNVSMQDEYCLVSVYDNEGNLDEMIHSLSFSNLSLENGYTFKVKKSVTFTPSHEN